MVKMSMLLECASTRRPPDSEGVQIPEPAQPSTLVLSTSRSIQATSVHLLELSANSRCYDLTQSRSTAFTVPQSVGPVLGTTRQQCSSHYLRGGALSLSRAPIPLDYRCTEGSSSRQSPYSHSPSLSFSTYSHISSTHPQP